MENKTWHYCITHVPLAQMIPHRTQLEIHLYAFYAWTVLNMWISILENEDVPKLPHVCLPEWFCPISTNIWTLAFQIWITICSICPNSLMKSPFLSRNFIWHLATNLMHQPSNLPKTIQKNLTKLQGERNGSYFFQLEDGFKNRPSGTQSLGCLDLPKSNHESSIRLDGEGKQFCMHH